MASGHVNRIKRPNTRLHRPSLLREESPCQSGAVHTWHFSDMPTWPLDVCSRRNIGLKIPWRDVSIQVASRHGGTTCDPKERFGNSLSLSLIACSENLEGHSL